MFRLLTMTMLAGSVALIGCEDTYDDTATNGDTTLNGDATDTTTTNPGTTTPPPTADDPSQMSPDATLFARYDRVSDDFRDLNTWIETSGENVSQEVVDARDTIRDQMQDVEDRLEEMRDQAGEVTAETRAEISAALDEVQQSLNNALDHVRGTTPPPAPNTPPASTPQ